MMKRLPILDIWVDNVSMEQAITRIDLFIRRGERPHTIFASNPEKNFSIPKDPLLYDCFRNADLLVPDGVGVVAAARILHGVKLSRLPGVDLMHSICRLSAARGYRVFFYGATEEVNRVACESLVEMYPGLVVAGRANGYLTDSEMPALVENINAAKAQVLFLALGSPKQERWLAAYLQQLCSVRVCQGVGGTLDTVAGTVKRAPEIWCRWNLEWLYRLIEEPKRISRQKVLPVFAAKVIAAKLLHLGRRSPAATE